MAVELVLPRFGREMESGLLAEWYVPDGAPVGRGELVYRLETDYVACDIEAEVEGVVRHGLPAGEDAAPGAAVGTIVEA
ncbi:MAG: lipoyl domain-containing protein, partial [Dehalococcoidia bacterium]